MPPWGELELPAFPGLPESVAPSPVLTPRKRHFSPEVERMRPEAESMFESAEEVDAWLQEKETALTLTRNQLPSGRTTLTSLTGLSERERQRQMRIQGQGIADSEARIEAASAETNDPYQLVSRATRAVLRPVQKIAGEAGADLLGGTIGQLGANMPTPGFSGASTPRRAPLEGAARSVGRGIGEALVPTTPAELAMEAAAGPVLGLGARGARAGLRGAVSLAHPAAAAIRREVVGAPASLVRVAVRPNAISAVTEEGLAASRGAVRVTDPAGVRILKPDEELLEGEQLLFHGTAGEMRGPIREGTNLTPNEKDAQTFAGVSSALSRNKSMVGVARRADPEFGGGVPGKLIGQGDDVPDDVSRMAFGEQNLDPDTAKSTMSDMAEEIGEARKAVARTTPGTPERVSAEAAHDEVFKRVQETTARAGLTPADDPMMAAWTRSVRKLQEAKAQGPEALEAERVRQNKFVSDRLIREKAIEKQNRLNRYSNTGKSRQQQLREAVEKAKKALQDERGSVSPDDMRRGLQQNIDALKAKFIRAGELGEAPDTGDLDEYIALLEEAKKGPGQTTPPGQSSLEGMGVPPTVPLSPMADDLIERGRRVMAQIEAGKQESLGRAGLMGLRTQLGRIQRQMQEAGIPDDVVRTRLPESTLDEWRQARQGRVASIDIPANPAEGRPIPASARTDPAEYQKWREMYEEAQKGNLVSVKEEWSTLMGDAGKGAGKPPKKPGQYTLEGSFEPTKKSGSVVAEVLRSIVSIPGEAIANVTALSPPLLRQGRVRLITNPVHAMREFGQSLMAGWKEGYATQVDQGIRSASWVRKTEGGAFNSGYTWEDVKGHLLPLDGSPEERELVANSALGRALRKFGPRKMSDRQAITMLNLNRTNWYTEVAQNMFDAGERDVTEFRKLRERIEHFTQRGSWGQPGNLPLFFSARAQSGRVQALWDMMRDVPSGVISGKIARPGYERESAKALVATVTANMAMMGAMGVVAGNIEFKNGLPTFRDGAFHWDPWAGWNGPAKLVLGIGEDIATTAGDVMGEKGWDAADDQLAQTADRFIRYARNQLSPAFGAATAALTGKDFAGNKYNLGDEIKSGGLLADLTLPLQIEDIVEAYKEGGPAAAVAVGVPSTLSESVSVYKTLTEMRDDAARKGVDVDGKFITANNYDSISPKAKQAIDKQEQVAAFIKENPSAYREDKARLEGKFPAIVEAPKAEERFQAGVLDRPIREYWKEESQSRRDLAVVLKDKFEKQFANFDSNKFDKAVEGYYAIQVNDEDENYSFDATEAARQDFYLKQPDDVKQWIDEALQVSRENKSPLHQEYLGYIDKKDAAGYFKEGITPAEREALDAANPELDVQSWKFGGGIKDKAGPALQSPNAVDRALALNLPNRDIKYEGATRPINQNEGSLEAWKANQKLLSFYQDAGTQVTKDRAAELIFGVRYDLLKDDDQARVRTRIRNDIASDPRGQAALVWWGVREEITPGPVLDEVKKLVAQYGPLQRKK